MRRNRFIQFLIVALLASTLLFATPTSARAASLWDWFFGNNDSNKNAEEQITAVSDGETKGKANLRHHVSSVITDTESEALVKMVGPGEKALSQLTPEEQKVIIARYGRGGALGSVTSAITALYTPPASARTYVADLMNSAHLIPQAQAQGLGFSSLDPVLMVWKMFRNLAYLIFVIIFLVIGFMIMFRQKIGQTAVTIQQAIPNIVASLIFVTFSYAIAGFLIDLMYVVMYLLVGMFSSAKAQDIMQYSFFDLGWSVLTGQNGGGTSAFSTVFSNINQVVQAAVNMDGIGDAIGWISGLTAGVIMAVAVLIGVFKLFFELLKTYITIVLSIAFAPLILMMGALPGRNAFKEWIVNLAGNLLAFPTTLMIVIVYRMFSSVQLDTGGFLPPFLIGRGVAGTVTTLVGVGVILIMPEMIVEMKKAVGVKGGIFEQLGKAMVTNFGKGEVGIPLATGAVGTGVGAVVGGGSYLNKQARQIGGLKENFSWRGLGSAMMSGDSRKIGGKERVIGGIRNMGGSAYQSGQNVRRTIDRAKEGRLLDAEDPAKMFSEFLKKKEPEKKPARPTVAQTP